MQDEGVHIDDNDEDTQIMAPAQITIRKSKYAQLVYLDMLCALSSIRPGTEHANRAYMKMLCTMNRRTKTSGGPRLPEDS